MKKTTQTSQDTSIHQVRAELLTELISSAESVHKKFNPYAIGSKEIHGRCTQLNHDINLLHAMRSTEMSAAKMQDISYEDTVESVATRLDEQSEPLKGSSRHTCQDQSILPSFSCPACEEESEPSMYGKDDLIIDKFIKKEKSLNEPREHPCPSYEGTERIRITPKGEAMMKENERSENRDGFWPTEQSEQVCSYCDTPNKLLYGLNNICKACIDFLPIFQPSLIDSLQELADKSLIAQVQQQALALIKSMEACNMDMPMKDTPAITNERQRYKNLRKALTEYAQTSMISAHLFCPALHNQAHYFLELMERYDVDNNGSSEA